MKSISMISVVSAFLFCISAHAAGEGAYICKVDDVGMPAPQYMVVNLPNGLNEGAPATLSIVGGSSSEAQVEVLGSSSFVFGKLSSTPDWYSPQRTSGAPQNKYDAIEIYPYNFTIDQVSLENGKDVEVILSGFKFSDGFSATYKPCKKLSKDVKLVVVPSTEVPPAPQPQPKEPTVIECSNPVELNPGQMPKSPATKVVVYLNRPDGVVFETNKPFHKMLKLKTLTFSHSAFRDGMVDHQDSESNVIVSINVMPTGEDSARLQVVARSNDTDFVGSSFSCNVK